MGILSKLNFRRNGMASSGSNRKTLYSSSLSEQRYAWNKHLLKILSQINPDNPSVLRHFTIYIRKVANCSYGWNDETFKKELKQDLKSNSHTSNIGVSTLSINIVLDKKFQQIAHKKSNETQFVKQVEDIILFGCKKRTDEQKFDKNALYSNSLPDQRYAWHKYFVEMLSTMEVDDFSSLKHFTIYIRKVTDCNYGWNDETFKTELKQVLCDGASHVGSSTLSIEVVSEKEFQRIADKEISDTQFKKQVEDIILFGSKKETDEQRFATAIDKRAFVINEFLKKFRSSTGTDSKLLENLVIIVVRNEDDNDMVQYDWVGKSFEDTLKRKLTDAFIGKIGSKSLQVVFKPKAETDDCICVIDNHVYYKWGKIDTSEAKIHKEVPYERIVAVISILEGTGSMIKHSYNLDSDVKKIYHIGRGVTSRKDGKYRTNDIVINDKEDDPELLERNTHVSGAHADIVFKNNKYCLQATIGGCRALGGSPTKIVRAENVYELRDITLLYPLEDGDILELGKNVFLKFTLL